jgi:hypothetical protein
MAETCRAVPYSSASTVCNKLFYASQLQGGLCGKFASGDRTSFKLLLLTQSSSERREISRK